MPGLDTRRVLEAVDAHFDVFVEELRQLCRIRSRRQDPEQMVAAAEFIAKAVTRWGGSAEVIPWADSHPYVLGETAGERDKGLLHFLHYDVEVEPPGDDADWVSAPYAAEIRDGRLFARGVADDKGALMSRIHAAAAWRLAGQRAPVTSRYIVEGKRWLHSPGLGSFVRAYAHRLQCAGALWENSWVDEAGRPLLKLGEKGILYLRLIVRTLPRELTSQNTVLLRSATTRLVAALALLQDADGTVSVPGFADGVRRPTAEERHLLEDVAFDADFLRRRAEVDTFVGGLGEREAALAIRTVPSLTIAGISGGDMRDDVTLAIPAIAHAKVEIRLVADQDPERVLAAVRKHLIDSGFDDVEVEVMAMTRPNRTDHRDPFVTLVADAARRTYGVEPVIEPYTQWVGNQGVLRGTPIVGVGVSRADSGIDGPNEHIRLEDYRTGIKHVIEVMAAMAS